MKYVLNKCYGGFSVSKAVFAELGIGDDCTSECDGRFYGFLENKHFGIASDDYMAYRSDPRLIAAIEKIGLPGSCGPLAKLEIVEIPDGVEIEWGEYDGIESIHEIHRSW